MGVGSGWEGERNIVYKGMKISPSYMRFYNLEGEPKEDNIY